MQVSKVSIVVILSTELLLSLCTGAIIIKDDRFTQQGYYGRSVEVNLCGEPGEDDISDGFCSCKDDVISCDFSKFPIGEKPVHMNLASAWETDLVKRVCICGAPKNLEVLFSGTFLRDHHSVNRVDIYNMVGPISIAAAFDMNFSGDIYMAKIRYLREIIPWGFGRGFTINLADTEGLECCSKIHAPKLSSPAFFVEDTTIGTIRNSGLNEQHLWRSIVFNKVVFNEIEEYGIRLASTDTLALNTSFTNCEFNNLGQNSIALIGFTNLLIANSVFNDSCHEGSINARTNVPSSAIGLIGNIVLGPQIFWFDGNTIIIWYNKFQYWDNHTFASLGVSNHNDRNFSLAYNAVEELNTTSDKILPFQPSGTAFSENLLSYCKCSNPSLTNTTGNPLSNLTNRCEIRNPAYHCHLSLEIAQSECNKEDEPLPSDFLKHCQPVLTRYDDSVGKPHLDIESSFFREMVTFFALASFQLPELKEDVQDTAHAAVTASLPEIVDDGRTNKTIGNMINRLISDSLLIVAYYFS